MKKYLLLIAIILIFQIGFSSAVWTQSMNTGLNAYYRFDNSTTNIPEIINGKVNLTIAGNCDMLSGKSGRSLNSNGINCIATNNVSFQSLHIGAGNFTISTWMKLNLSNTDYGATAFLTDFGTNRTDQVGSRSGISSTIPRTSNMPLWYGRFFGVGTEIAIPDNNISTDWTHLLITARNGTILYYINGTRQSYNASYNLNVSPAYPIFLLSRLNREAEANLSINTTGNLDDISIWDRAFSDSEITNFYNNGLGSFYTPNISIGLVSPSNNSEINNLNPVTFNCSANSETEIKNMTLFIDGAVNYSESTNGFGVFSINRTVTFLHEGSHNWTCSASNLLNNTIANNFTFNIQTPPSITINRPLNVETSQTIAINITLGLDDGLASFCYFNITQSGSIVINNTQIPSCTNTTTAITSDGGYTINIFANKTNGQANTTSKTFSIATNTAGGGSSGGGGGGAGGPSSTQLPVIGVNAVTTKTFSALSKEIIYATINTLCSIRQGETFAILDYSDRCNLNQNDLNLITQNLSKSEVGITTEDLLKFYASYKISDLFQGYETAETIKKYNLFTSVLGITNPLTLSPPSFDVPRLIFADKSVTLDLVSNANKPLKSCEIISNTPGLVCDVTNTTVKISYTINNTNFLSRIFSGSVSVTTEAKESVTEVKPLRIVLRVYNLNYMVFGMPVYIIGIIVIIVILVLGIVGFKRYRKKLRKIL